MKYIWILFLLFTTAVHAAQPYGIADFSKQDAWNTAGMVDHFVMGSGLRGDLTGHAGDLEAWDGSHAQCTDCPTGFTCTCSGTADINSETTKIIKTDTSAVMFDGDGRATLFYEFTLEAGKYYMVTFWHMGVLGSEDVALKIYDGVPSEYYDFATNTWTGINTWLNLPNIGTSWVKTTAFVATGPVTKTDYLFQYYTSSADDTIYVDNIEIQELYALPTGRMQSVIGVPTTADPQFSYSKDPMVRVGQSQPTSLGIRFDGTDDYLTRDIDDDRFDPVTYNSLGSFSVGCRGILETTGSFATMIAKWDSASNQRSWILLLTSSELPRVYMNNVGVVGGSNFSHTTAVTTDTLNSVLATYDYVNDGASVGTIYLNNVASVSDATQNGPPFDTSAELEIGAYDAGTSAYFTGTISECTVWDTALDSVAANKWLNPYFPGSHYSQIDGFYVDTCTQAASHATCTWDRCRDGTPNACQAEGTGVMAIFDQYIELIENNSEETYTGDDSVPDFSDWVDVESAGDGTAVLSAYHADVFHGSTVARMSTTGTTSYIYQQSNCSTTGLGSTLAIEAVTKKFSGTAAFQIVLHEFDSATCTTELATNTIIDTDIEQAWKIQSGSFTAGSWHGSTSSYYIRVQSMQSAADFLVDSISVKVADHHTPWIHCPDGSATTTYNARDYRLHNPLSDYIPEEHAEAFDSGACMGVVLYTDWDGNDSTQHRILATPSTGAAGDYISVHKGSSNDLTISINHSVPGNWRSVYTVVNATTWTGGQWKYVEVCWDNSTLVKGRWYEYDTGTWYTMSSTSGAGSYVMADMSDELHVGHLNGAEFLDGYIWKIEVGPYNAIYPEYGFDQTPAFDPY